MRISAFFMAGPYRSHIVLRTCYLVSVCISKVVTLGVTLVAGRGV